MHLVRTAPRLFLCLALATIGLAGCERDTRGGSHTATKEMAPSTFDPGTPPPAASAPGASATAPAATTGQANAPGDGQLTGTVTETMNSGGYTYAKVDRGGSQVWVAGPETKIEVGAKVGPMSGMAMPGFRSETLNRTFDEIYFVNDFGTIATQSAWGGSPGSASGSAAPANPHGGAPPATAVTDKIAPPAGGKAIADVFASKAELAGKEVTVRGKVVKVNNGILDRNWLHLQDGSGGPGTNDLLVTTSAEAQVGTIVTARGTIAADKDYGGGYKYALVLEGATLTSQ
jgi:hypothetical protein